MFDALSSITKDENRGVEYPAYSVMPSEFVDDKLFEDLRNRTLGQEAKTCVFPISATLQLNSAIAVKFRERLKKKLIAFLVDDNLEEEFLIKAGNKDIIDQFETETRAYLLQAHIQTSLLINECIALEMRMVNGDIRLEEPDGARKDRYTAVSYLNYYVSLLDAELLREELNTSDEEEFLGVAQVY